VYRSTRVFHGQYRLLLTTSLLEDAEQRLNAAQHSGSPLAAWRARRDTERLWDVVDAQRGRLVEPEWWRLGADEAQYAHIAPTELIHPRLRAYIRPAAVADASKLAVEHEVVRPVRLGIERAVVAAALLSMAATVAQIAVQGIGDRAALIAAELCTLLFVPLAIAVSAEWTRRRG
jgi:hypothetical protein